MPLRLQGDGEQPRDHREVYELLRARRRLLIVAPPGAGETMLTRQLVTSSAQEQLVIPNAQCQLDLAEVDRLPLRMPMLSLVPLFKHGVLIRWRGLWRSPLTMRQLLLC